MVQWRKMLLCPLSVFEVEESIRESRREQTEKDQKKNHELKSVVWVGLHLGGDTWNGELVLTFRIDGYIQRDCPLEKRNVTARTAVRWANSNQGDARQRRIAEEVLDWT